MLYKILKIIKNFLKIFYKEITFNVMKYKNY